MIKSPFVLPIVVGLVSIVQHVPAEDLGEKTQPEPAAQCIEATLWMNGKARPLNKEDRQQARTLAGRLLESSTDRSRKLVDEHTWTGDSARHLCLEIKFDGPVEFDPPARPETRLSAMLLVLETGKERIYVKTVDGLLSPFIALDADHIGNLKKFLSGIEK